MKKILSVLLLSLFFTNTLFAQEEAKPDMSGINAVHVSSILMNGETFTTGRDINGTFNISNVSERVVSGVTYRMELVEILKETNGYDYGNGVSPISDLSVDVPSETLSYSTLSDPISVPPGSKTMNFNYKIPDKVPEGRIGFLVQLYVNDVRSKYDFIEIDIRGKRVSTVLAYGNVSVKSPDKEEAEIFTALEGPNIEKNETANLEVLIRSDLVESLNLVPELKIFSGSDSNGKLVYSKKFDVISVPTGEKLLSYPLKLDMEPGVYTGILDYLDNTGTSRSTPVEIRYIIDGSKPKLGEVSYNTTDLVGNTFLVSVSYLVPSLNFRTNEDGSFKDSRVKDFVELNTDLDFNNLPEDSEKISINEPNYFLEKMSTVVRIKDFQTSSILKEETSNFDGSAEVVVDLGGLKGADKIIVEVDLYQDGKILDSHTDIVDVKTTDYKNGFDKIWDQYRKFIAIFLLLIAIGLTLMLFKSGRADKNTTIASVVAIVLIGTSLMSVGNAQAKGGMRIESSYLSNFSVNSPQPPAVRIYTPGEVFTFSLDFDFGYCTNSGYSLNGRMNQPYLAGTGQTAMGGWSGLSQGASLGRLWGDASNKHFKYKSAINWPIQAPYTPGTYVFQYEVATRSGDWGDSEYGTVVFQVGSDQCKNASFPGVQATVPAGYWQFTDVNGLLVCSSRPPSALKCSASKNRLLTGESVTYTSTRIDGLKADHTWFKGGSTNVPSVKKDTNVVQSSYTNSYSEPGMYLTTVATTDTYGKESVCRIGVTVGSDFDNISLFLGSVEEDFLEEEKKYYTDEDGKRYRLDPSAGEGKIEFDMDGGFTNKTCKIKWNATNVLKCGLYKNNILSKKLEFSGEEEVEPGTYRIKCRQSRDGAEVVSEEKTCRSNPDFRER